MIDQFGATYLDRVRPYLKGGLKTLMTRGAVFPNGVHRYANTATCPGHATIVTGAWPHVHGIVNNKWFDEKTGAKTPCTQDDRFNHSPRLRMAPSFADQLNILSDGKSKSVTISMKPRVAVISSAESPTASVWYDRSSGRFVSGTWYNQKASPKWVNQINQSRNASMTFGLKWEYFRKDLDYEAITGKDDRPYEYDVKGLGRTFPRTYGQGLKPGDERWLGSYRGTPHALESMFALAKAAIKTEKLGQSEHVDFLMIGVSTLDFIGHWYGPRSHEALDTIFRIDHEIQSLIDFVEAQYGRDAVLWSVSADHGVVATPEENQRRGINAKRVDTEKLKAEVNAALKPYAKKRGQPTTVTTIDPPFVVLSHGNMTKSKELIIDEAVKALLRSPSIAEAFPTNEISKMKAPFRVMYERMVYPGRRSDILIRSHPHDWIDPGNWTTGTGHGSPYVYDTHVPIIFAGPRVAAQTNYESVDVTRIVPTLSAILNFSPPSAALDEPLPFTTN